MARRLARFDDVSFTPVDRDEAPELAGSALLDAGTVDGRSPCVMPTTAVHGDWLGARSASMSAFRPVMRCRGER